MPPVDICVDAQAVFDVIAAPECCTPAEASLKLHLLSIRNRVDRGLVRNLYWTDTRDMLAGALTKGGVNRSQLQHALNAGILELDDPVKRCHRHTLPSNTIRPKGS